MRSGGMKSFIFELVYCACDDNITVAGLQRWSACLLPLDREMYDEIACLDVCYSMLRMRCSTIVVYDLYLSSLT